jgi:tetratricopeptide (TPR) repeat protein
LEFEIASRTKDVLERSAALKIADQHLIGLLGRRGTAHAHHTKCKVEILRLQVVLEDSEATDEEEVRAIQDAENAVWTALQQYPEDSFILDSEARLATLLNESERAQKALEAAAKNNLRNATVVTRLLRLYREIGAGEKARELLRVASDAAPQERRYHFENARMMMADEAAGVAVDGVTIERTLRKSFNEGDSNRLAQFLHARQIYVNGRERDAKERFLSLAAAGWDSGGFRDEWIWREKGQPRTFVGRVARVQRSHGFVQRDGTGEWIFVPHPRDGEHPLINFEVGARVQFNIGFNLRGPVALNVSGQDN